MHSLGYSLLYLMQKVSNLMNQLSFCAFPAHTRINTLQVGQIIEINEKFRTKNVPSISQVENNEYSPCGDLHHDAHLYRNTDNFRVVLTIDPRWLATSTAFVNFKSGWIDVAGLGMITRIDTEQKVIHITPYVLGVPKSPLDDLFNMLSKLS